MYGGGRGLGWGKEIMHPHSASVWGRALTPSWESAGRGGNEDRNPYLLLAGAEAGPRVL